MTVGMRWPAAGDWPIAIAVYSEINHLGTRRHGSSCQSGRDSVHNGSAKPGQLPPRASRASLRAEVAPLQSRSLRRWKELINGQPYESSVALIWSLNLDKMHCITRVNASHLLRGLL
jgi:hypothetical protein